MFCTKFKRQVRGLLQQFDRYLDTHVSTALQVTTAIKQLLASPAGDVLTAIIPGNLDNLVRDIAVAGLGKIADALAIAEQCRQCATDKGKIECLIKQLQQYDPRLQDALLLKIASLLTGYLHGHQLRQSLYDLYTQAKYTAEQQ